ncbi:MAG: response regulator [Lachnospiraceae bacterium]|nr:response regulator [Lachnospiraceae bacterium]
MNNEVQAEEKLSILIADDAEMNRIILKEMLKDSYEILEAEDGEEALKVIKEIGNNLDLILLDCIMPKVNGFDVLNEMRRMWWKVDIPVIMISAENDRAFIVKAYRLGAVDYITRPFDCAIVQHRVNGVMHMHKQEKYFYDMATTQMMEKYHNNNMLMHILSGIVEFRNGESGKHILNVQMLTDMFLREIISISDKYELTSEEISNIYTAAAIHDIGKISIPDHIINKPGRLTEEEFQIMKAHSSIGYDMLCKLEMYQEEPLLKTCKEVVRWHHERFDGRGYPDGLEGDDIPISAQVVSLADVYDALTSERCYKKAFTHEKTIEMIKNGECGQFNPLLIQCLDNLYDVIPKRMQSDSASHMDEEEMLRMVEEMMRTEG